MEEQKDFVVEIAYGDKNLKECLLSYFQMKQNNKGTEREIEIEIEHSDL